MAQRDARTGWPVAGSGDRGRLLQRLPLRRVEENRGRLVELVPEVIGEMSTSLGGGDLDSENPRLDTDRNLVYGQLIDRTLPGRLFHGLKRLLGDQSIDRLSVFAKPFRLVALITPVLVRMREAIERHTRG